MKVQNFQIFSPFSSFIIVKYEVIGKTFLPRHPLLAVLQSQTEGYKSDKISTGDTRKTIIIRLYRVKAKLKSDAEKIT